MLLTYFLLRALSELIGVVVAGSWSIISTDVVPSTESLSVASVSSFRSLLFEISNDIDSRPSKCNRVSVR